MPSARNNGVEHGGVLGVPVPDREPVGPLPQVQHQVAGLLRHPVTGRLAVAPSRCTRRVAISMRNST
jgi:hypothetical protein